MTTTRGALSPVNQAIALEILAFRKRAGLTQDQLAERVRMNPGVYRRYETGERAISVADLDRIAAALGVGAGDIWRDARRHTAGVFASRPADEEDDGTLATPTRPPERVGEGDEEPVDTPEPTEQPDTTRPESAARTRRGTGPATASRWPR
jgi:transcriptional regulator with XRE-family HTH domain